MAQMCLRSEEIPGTTDVQQPPTEEVKTDSTHVQEESKAAIHHQMDHKSLLHSDALYQCIHLLETFDWLNERVPS